MLVVDRQYPRDPGTIGGDVNARAALRLVWWATAIMACGFVVLTFVQALFGCTCP